MLSFLVTRMARGNVARVFFLGCVTCACLPGMVGTDDFGLAVTGAHLASSDD